METLKRTNSELQLILKLNQIIKYKLKVKIIGVSTDPIPYIQSNNNYWCLIRHLMDIYIYVSLDIIGFTKFFCSIWIKFKLVIYHLLVLKHYVGFIFINYFNCVYGIYYVSIDTFFYHMIKVKTRTIWSKIFKLFGFYHEG